MTCVFTCAVVAKLLGIDAPSLSKWLTHRKIQTGREVFNKPQDEDNAKRARDALSKHIYAHVFEWIVERINQVCVLPLYAVVRVLFAFGL